MYQSCEYCNKSFHAERVTARFCSTKCRVKFNREKNRSKKITLPAADNDNLTRLLVESDKTSHSLRMAITELKVNRTNRLLELLDRLCQLNSDNIRQIANLVANSANQANPKQYVWICKNCGQNTFFDPKEGKCDFCGKINWIKRNWHLTKSTF